MTDLKRYHHRSIRLRGYDYTRAGAYFVTICTKDHACLLGEIEDAEMVLNDAGRIASDCLCAVEQHFRTVELDAFVVMPNHVHAIIVIIDARGSLECAPVVRVGAQHAAPPQPATSRPTVTPGSLAPVVRSKSVAGAPVVRVGAQHAAPPQPASSPPTVTPGSLAAVVRSYKSAVTRQVRQQSGSSGIQVWQRNYYEHIVRNEDSLNRIRQYIADNPARWEFDRENPSARNPTIDEVWHQHP